MESQYLDPTNYPWGIKVGYIMPMPSASGNGDWIVYMHPIEGAGRDHRYASHIFEPMSLDYLS